MTTTSRDDPPRLGAQLWLEPGMSDARVEILLDAAAQAGLTAIRLMLLWPLVEPTPGVRDHRVFDAAVAGAERRGLRLWLTLGAESLPWHHGVPGSVQSAPVPLPATDDQRAVRRDFLLDCVRRYCGSSALERWLVWNEPQNPGPDRAHRRDFASARERELWGDVLRETYRDVDDLNQRWLCGFAGFDAVPHPTQVLAAGRWSEPFACQELWMAEAKLRARALADEVAWTAGVIREVDADTPISANPPALWDNWAWSGYDLGSSFASCDVLGASIHAPWHLGFTGTETHPALIAVGVGLLRAAHGDRVDLTELQAGNVTAGAPHAADTTPDALAGSLLAATAAGAESAIVWALNSRSSGFEAGDWGLVDEDAPDAPTPHMDACAAVARVVRALTDRLGPWRPADPVAHALVSVESMGVEMARSLAASDAWGQDASRGVRRAASVLVSAMRRGHQSQLVTPERLDHVQPGSAVMVPHGIGLPDAALEALDRALERGVTVVIDAESLRFDDLGRRRPASAFALRHGYHVQRWSRDGVRSLDRFGLPAGNSDGPVAEVRLHDEAWRVDTRWSIAGRPVVLRRTTEPLVLSTALLNGLPEGNPGLVSDLWHDLLGDAAVVPLTPHATVQRVLGPHGAAYALVSPTPADGTRVLTPTGTWTDLFTGTAFTVTDPARGLTLPPGQAVAVLVQDR